MLARIRQEMAPPSHTNLSALRADLYRSIPLGNRSVDICLMVNVLHGLYADKTINSLPYRHCHMPDSGLTKSEGVV